VPTIRLAQKPESCFAASLQEEAPGILFPSGFAELRDPVPQTRPEKKREKLTGKDESTSSASLWLIGSEKARTVTQPSLKPNSTFTQPTCNPFCQSYQLSNRNENLDR
jgi:hypothetical protein